MNSIKWISLILVIIGGLNWGLVGFFEYNLVASLFGEMSTVSKIIYALVGLGAIHIAVVSPHMMR